MTRVILSPKTKRQKIANVWAHRARITSGQLSTIEAPKPLPLVFLPASGVVITSSEPGAGCGGIPVEDALCRAIFE